MIIQIPFSGFYNSIHSCNIENELDNSIFSDHYTGSINSDRLIELAYNSINWHDLYVDYAREYVDAFNHKFGLNLVFESLSSPREYNFVTDRIFCHIEYDDALQLLNVKGIGMSLEKHAKSMFTSRCGFSSFYDSDCSALGLLCDYDHNQLYCLLLAWLECKHDVAEWGECELYLMDDAMCCNGLGYELIYKHCDNKRLFTISDYLHARAERVLA